MNRSPALAAALTAILAALALVGPADGAQPSAAKLRSQQAAEAARAKALKKQAQDAARDEANLKTGLADVSAKASETKQAAFTAEGEAAALETRRLNAAADLAHDRRVLELTIAALIQREADSQAMPLTPVDARTGGVVGYTIPALARSVNEREAKLSESERLVLAKYQEREELDAASRELAAQQAATQAALGEAAKRRTSLLAESDRAAKRAAALGRQAKSLQELTAKVAPAAPKKAGVKALVQPPSGPRRAPVDGQIITAFGAATPAGAAKGVTLRTKPGAKVVAPTGATVGYAGSFRSYGQVVILDQGNGYSIVLTGLQTILASPGKKVSAGEVVGEMASPSASTPPELYFEVREAGRAVDPERWLKARM